MTAIQRQYADKGESGMAKVAKTFKLEPEQWATLEAAAKASGKTLTATLADLIEEKPQAEGSRLEEAVSGTVEALREQLAAKDAQLEAKDRQLSDLTESLRIVSRSLQAAQTLHAADTMPELVGAEGKPEKRTFRDRWQAF